MKKLSWLAVEGCFLWLFIRFGNAVCLALSAGLLLIPLICVPLNLMLRSRLRLELEPPEHLRKDTPAQLYIRVISPIPVQVGYTCTLGNLLNGSQSKVRLDGDSALELESRHCGRLCITVDHVRLYDPFGLIGIPAKSTARTHITVQPECFEPQITLLSVPGATADSERYAEDRPGWDLTEVYQLRDYVPGDSPRQIHWKLSGKFDRLIVRDPGMPVVQDVLLFWERTGKAVSDDLLDAQAEIIVSIARALLEQSVSFRLGWNDTAENRCILHEIESLEDLIGVLPRLLSAAGRTETESGAELLVGTCPDALCSHIVYLAAEPDPVVLQWQNYGHVTVLSCTPGADALLFDETNYPAQLSRLEL